MSKALRVLIVEDSEADTMLLLRALRHAGYEPASRRVETASALAAALQEQQWDIVLSDFRLPGFDGLEALKLVQAADRDLPFILVSGVIGEETAVQAMKAGAHDYVLKDTLARLGPAVERELRDVEVRNQRRRVLDRLRESERRYRTLFETMTEGFLLGEIICDAAGKPVDWRVLDANPAFEAQTCLLGFARPGKTAREFAPNLEPFWLERFGEVALTGNPTRFEHFIALSGKHVHVMAFRPSPGRFAALFKDITDRKRAGDALRESERRYRTMFETLIEGFCVIEVVFDSDNKPVDYRFLEINPAFEAQTGLKNAQGRLVRELIPNLEAHWFEIYGKVALTGEPVHFVNEARTLNRWYDVSAYRVGGPESRKVAILFNDITERIGAERALLEMNATLEQSVSERTAVVQKQADRLRALAVELSQAEQRERKRLAGILHDHIQQLLVAAQMQLSLIERADPKTVRSTVQGISGIVVEAIAASRSLTVELTPPILHQSGLTAALTWLAAREEEKRLFKVHVRADSDAEPANPDVCVLIFEAVRELLLNAVKHSGVREAQLTMRRSNTNWTQIVVEDKGKGFDPSAISAHRGGGFGLFSIQQRLEYLGGRMEVESAPGRGARFVLTIPIGEAAAKEAAADAGVAQAPSPVGPSQPGAAVPHSPKGRKITVLLVDDHRIVRQGISSLLELEDDIEVVGEAENGRKAVELARRLTPDVVIMDVNMPVMDGIEATRIVGKELPQIKVIALSMHMERDTAESMRQAGAVAYLTKGGPSEDLVAAIRAAGRQGA